jgi:hypothetical protein
LTKKSAGVGGSGEGERLRKRSKTPRKDEFTEFSQERGNDAFSKMAPIVQINENKKNQT